MQTTEGGKNVCTCPHHKVVPGMILLIGVDLLLGALGILSSQTVDILLAVFLIVIGGTKLGSYKCTCC